MHLIPSQAGIRQNAGDVEKDLILDNIVQSVTQSVIDATAKDTMSHSVFLKQWQNWYHSWWN